MAMTSIGTSATTEAGPGSTNRSAMAMVTTLFFMWGFLTSLNDILIPHLKSIFSLNYVQATLVQFAFFTSYAIFALPAGKVVEWIGYQRTMVVGLLVMGTGAILFLPAAAVPSYNLFLGALIVLAAGITVLQVAANPYVTALGPSQTASSRLNLTQAFNSLGTVIGPPLGGYLILSHAGKAITNIKTLSGSALQAYRVHEAATVRMPYIAIALALVVLATAIGLYKFPRLELTRDFRPAVPGQTDSVWHHPHLYWGALAIFLYVGAEVSIGSFLVNYFNDPLIGNLSVSAAANLLAFYWGGAMVGRFIGAAVLQRFSPARALGLCAVIAAALVCTSMLTFGHTAMVSILAIGLFNSIMFPTIFALGLAELGPLTGKGSGLMVFSIVGGALIPLAQGALADRMGLHHAFFLPVLCYIFIAWYGFRGSRIAHAA